MAIIPSEYLASLSMAIRQQLAQRGQLVGRVFLFLVIVYLFSQVFLNVSAPAERLWYLAITEWIILSTPPIAFRISDDINDGHIVYFLLRPIRYISLRFFESLGEFWVRFILLGFVCFPFAYALTGTIPGNINTWVLGIFFAIIAVILNTSVGILLGLCAFWIKDIKTLIYLNLTATFCFGGLIVPLSFYSPLLQKICFYTPYPWILWWPAEYFTGGSLIGLKGMLGFGAWLLVLFLLIQFLYQKCIHSFVVEGG